MAGGYGGRFWPLCTETSPKQFLDLMGTGHSMLQTTFERYSQVCPRENIIVVTAAGYGERVHQQISGLLDYQVLEEPQRRNTAPCIAYAASVIAELNPNATVIVTPSDHAIFGEEQFLKSIAEATRVVNRYDWIVTLGARPSNPNTKYGYIQFAEHPSVPTIEHLHKVITFTEKPPVEMAIQFIQTGEFLWNMGIFVWRLPVLQAAYKKYLPDIADSILTLGMTASPDTVLQSYNDSRTISVDFGIMEKAYNVHVLEANFGWSDVETWDLLFNTCPKDEDNNAIIAGDVMTYDVHNCVINLPYYQGTLVLQGLEGYIVTANKDIMMICPRNQQEQIVRYTGDYELRMAKRHRQEQTSPTVSHPHDATATLSTGQE